MYSFDQNVQLFAKGQFRDVYTGIVKKGNLDKFFNEGNHIVAKVFNKKYK